MIYELDTVSSRNPLIPWIYIFRSLSIPQFQEVYAKLNFPVNPTDDLRRLARDFVIAFDIHLGNPITETASIDLLHGTSLKDGVRKKAEILFTNMFSHLERMGYAKAIFDWGKHTSDYYEYENVKQLGSWCSLLLKWAVLEQVRQPILPKDELYSRDWEEVMAKWMPIYTRKPPEPFKQMRLEQLPLWEDASLTLRATILHYEAERLHFETVLEQILASSKSTWEDFVLRSGGSYIWMKGEAIFRIHLREWKTIVDKLSADEMSILEAWGLKDTYHKIKTPLQNFVF
jgi:hypothetical protein